MADALLYRRRLNHTLRPPDRIITRSQAFCFPDRSFRRCIVPKYVALFYEAAGDADPSRSEEFEAASHEDAQEVANGMKTGEARVDVHALPDGLSDDRALGRAGL